MSFVIPALISAASAAAGGYAAYRGGKQQASSARDVMREQMDFQREMSNTAIRRHMNDLREAGLNPILAYSSLGGASTPSGSSYTPQNYIGEAANSAASVGRSASDAVISSLQMKMLKGQLEGLRLQNTNAMLEAEYKALKNVEAQYEAEKVADRQALYNSAKSFLGSRGISAVRGAASYLGGIVPRLLMLALLKK